ncbi:hypothetical protein RRG08_026224 [Elysia crispata]|uniref:Uncharacterized protein n=1 Tax=Elysia crispata TaxID=231223 RepID=A0AAE0ZAI0_9GAST|nr:hypothetical protein RRG08_026224 [Elysia crispata]
MKRVGKQICKETLVSDEFPRRSVSKPNTRNGLDEQIPWLSLSMSQNRYFSRNKPKHQRRRGVHQGKVSCHSPSRDDHKDQSQRRDFSLEAGSTSTYIYTLVLGITQRRVGRRERDQGCALLGRVRHVTP